MMEGSSIYKLLLFIRLIIIIHTMEILEEVYQKLQSHYLKNTKLNTKIGIKPALVEEVFYFINNYI